MICQYGVIIIISFKGDKTNQNITGVIMPSMEAFSY